MKNSIAKNKLFSSKKLTFILIGFSILFILSSNCRRKNSALPEYAFGGDFTLTDQNGKPFSLKDVRGSVVVIFFGYTNCPDVCPTTLSRLSHVYKNMGDDAKDIKTIFITVDPERDTQDKLKKYLEYFQLDTIGLRGTVKEISNVASIYKIFYNKHYTGSASGYAVDHTSTMFILDRNGKIRYLFKHADDPKTLPLILKMVLDYPEIKEK